MLKMDSTLQEEELNIRRYIKANPYVNMRSNKSQFQAEMPGGLFYTKIPIWVYFGGPWNGKCWYVLCPFGIFYGHVVHAMVMFWYISPKNLATL
jgi:hypothetical protein